MGVCFKGFDELAELLVNKGANVNVKNSMGGTCLIYAATFNKPKIAKLLLDNGADASVKDNRGHTALDHAKLQGSHELINMLEG